MKIVCVSIMIWKYLGIIEDDMRKRMILFIIMLFLTAGITYGQYYYAKSLVKETPLTMVCCSNKDIDRGEKIKKEDLVYKSLKTADLDSRYIVSDELAVDKYAVSTILSGSILLHGQVQVSSELKMTSSDKNILVTFEFDNATSNAWNIRNGQYIQLLFCGEDGEEILYDQVVVFAIYDQYVIDSEESEVTEMKYVTFEVEKTLGYDLVKRRKDGRLEIIIM